MEMRTESLDWINLAVDRNRCRSLENTIINIRRPWTEGNVLITWPLATVRFLKIPRCAQLVFREDADAWENTHENVWIYRNWEHGNKVMWYDVVESVALKHVSSLQMQFLEAARRSLSHVETGVLEGVKSGLDPTTWQYRPRDGDRLL
jgi:hypothetical protein